MFLSKDDIQEYFKGCIGKRELEQQVEGSTITLDGIPITIMRYDHTYKIKPEILKRVKKK